MAEIVVFHHAQGLTDGMRAFAGRLHDAGHHVHLPDVFDGRTFDDLEAGVAHAREIGFGKVTERGVRAVESLPTEIVYAGFSMGVMPAQKLAQTRPRALGALFFDACLPVSEFGEAWPQNLPVQVHGGSDDEWFDEDLAAARELVAAAGDAELFLYPGTAHLFADSSLAGHDESATGDLTERTLTFLDRLS
ncbi:dienelactone hydrolase [Haloactinopolyspora alba]|uniref:Dienelactone hydrolase n=1 Tax=Haloactinopolyspora alba TaxID=648780 RepID=A0A2P8DXD0_9ACTN|nr:dienelactone hydrolase family protein [Haloactinopolyspora alba]PSL01827.1 dienelactone hydrolase [Haloactinopolyspora alba]